ncbi:MAG: helix-turn-helix domain-containing protein [Ruminococcus sp.]|nr:helix-turn-helix domain-containing protein [Ruminococcus sp.]MDE7138667.1 helix-turn-helix domain-containing protein [Ruminococcus sp.]
MYFQRLRDLREDKDMNQTQVAEILKIQQTVYSRYERGFQTIPLEHLITLADFYGVSIDYITDRTNVKEVIQKNREGRFIFKPFFK